MSSIEHIILYCFLFITFFLFSKKVYKAETKNEFIKLIWFPILLYALIEGSRYGRGPDFLSYKYRYEHLSFINEPQILFYYLMRLLHLFNLNYVGAYIVYALIFIVGVAYFIRKSYAKDEAQWMYLLALCSMLWRMESMIRQYIAIPFIFCAIVFMFERKKWHFIGSVLVANLIHSGTFVVIPFLIVSYFFIERTISYVYTIPLLFLMYYVIPTGIVSDVSIRGLEMFNLNSILGSDHMLHYIEDSDRWLGEGSIIEATTQTFLTKALQFLFECSILVMGYLALNIRPNQKVLFLYNIVIIGFVLSRLFFGYEIFQRMTGQLYIYWFVPAGYALFVYKKLVPKKDIYKLSITIMILYQGLFWGRFILLNPKAIFFWNI